MILTRLPLAMLGLLAITAQAAPPLALDDVFQLQYATNPIVDSRGKQVIYQRNFMDIMQDRRRSNLWMVDTSGEQHVPLVTGAVNVSSPALAPDDNRLAYVRKDDTGSQIFIHYIDSGRDAQLTRLPESPKQLEWSPDGQWLAFVMHTPAAPRPMGHLPPPPAGAQWAPAPVVVDSTKYRSDGKGFDPVGYSQVYLVPASGGSPRQLTHGEFHHGGGLAWAADSQSLYAVGNRNADWEINVVNSEIYRIDLASGALTAITDRAGPDQGVQASPDGKRILYTGWNDARMGYHRQRLYVADADGGNSRELLTDLDRDIEQARWSHDGKRIFFRYDDKGETRLAATDLRGRMQNLAEDLGGTSLGRPYGGASFDVGGGDTYAFTVGTSQSPADIAVGRRGSSDIRRVTALNDNLLGHRTLGKVEERWVKSSADGRDIQAWVAFPPDFDPKQQYPLLLEIHGGPFANYGPRFSAEVQLFASAGYVVLYGNPRGSTSYGEEFANMIHHNYPGEDYDDLMSTVDAIIAEGYIDPEQLYVTGGSGGGTLTSWIVGKTDRFRAAVVAKPVIDWISFSLTADNAAYFTRYWFGSMPWEDPEAYWARSPLSLVGNVTTPTMLLTGENDLRTPMGETEQYYQALKLRGVDSAMVRIPGAGHSIANRPSQLMAKVAAILAWFEQYSGADEAIAAGE